MDVETWNILIIFQAYRCALVQARLSAVPWIRNNVGLNNSCFESTLCQMTLHTTRDIITSFCSLRGFCADFRFDAGCKTSADETYAVSTS
jgi:hypothetical protein